MTNKNALEQLAQGRCKPRYHLGWGTRPHSAAASRNRAERARPDHGGLNRPTFGEARDVRLETCGAVSLQASSLKPQVSVFGGDVGNRTGCYYEDGFGAGLLVELTLSSTR